MKYDKIVEISKERSRQNTEVALRAIEEMLREGEWITVAELAKRTKLSRANFYVNKDIRKSLDDAERRGMDYRCRACQENKIIKSKFLCE